MTTQQITALTMFSEYAVDFYRKENVVCYKQMRAEAFKNYITGKYQLPNPSRWGTPEEAGRKFCAFIQRMKKEDYPV